MNNRELPDLANMDLLDIIDQLGEVKEQLSHQKRLEAIYKEALMARLSEDERELGVEKEGTYFQAIITKEAQMRFDSKGVRAEMGECWYQNHCKSNEFNKVRIVELKQDKEEE